MWQLYCEINRLQSPRLTDVDQDTNDKLKDLLKVDAPDIKKSVDRYPLRSEDSDTPGGIAAIGPCWSYCFNQPPSPCTSYPVWRRGSSYPVWRCGSRYPAWWREQPPGAWTLCQPWIQGQRNLAGLALVPGSAQNRQRQKRAGGTGNVANGPNFRLVKNRCQNSISFSKWT